MSIAIAVCNPEGVILATDSEASRFLPAGPLEAVLDAKILWLRGHRAACALFPFSQVTELVADDPEVAGEPASADLRSTVSAIWNENLALHEYGTARFGSGSVEYWRKPKLLVVALPPNGPLLLTIEEGELNESSGALAIRTIGAWNELEDGEARLGAVPWRRADNLARATKLVVDLMTAYLADYDQAVRTDAATMAAWGRTVGGPVNVATITRNRVKVETYGRTE